MPPFSAFFDFVAHHHHHHDDQSSVMDSSSSHSTFSVEGALPSCKRPLSPKPTESRKVSFFGSVRVQLIAGLDEFTEEEKAAAWYNRQDFDEIKRDRRATVKTMEQVNPRVDDAQQCYRGLEFKTRQGSKLKQWNVMESAMVVFDEQIQQMAAGRNDPEALSKAYHAATADSALAAAERVGLMIQGASAVAVVCVVFACLHVQGKQLFSCRAA
eukprot:CAMPEP_0178853798 /NCGR_PEP_ID=MMETSP0746-20121128/22448_1 /TAXON_ID=913974 /ORGANISM="Nitzschia punctata, Strain CCMP561" /LENGTH=212 /DNA_ID=CAMNT_0020519655 /DNA_START=305 /DNA_END=943 /DNA_ORIENTATION=-